MSKLDPVFLSELQRAQQLHVRRHLRSVTPAARGRIMVGDRSMVNFSSNDYLGLSQHPALIERAQQWASQYGAGAQASRLVCGNLTLHERVEAKLAHLKGTEAALLFASGWQANASVLPAILAAAGKHGQPRVFTDRLNHASLHHGCMAAGARQIRFRHNDLDHLEHLLSKHANGPETAFIITESVFSMDGDQTDVVSLAHLAQRHGAFVYLDEAHATGVLGPHGMGLSGLAPGSVDLAMGTFSKALGSFGAYVAGSRALCDYLLNTCSGFIYTTALPPAVLGAIDAALDLVPTMQAERAQLADSACYLRAGLARLGLNTGASSTHIIPAIIGDSGQTMALASALEREGMLASAIRPPTVPPNTSRLRIALSALHVRDDLDRLINALSSHLDLGIRPASHD